MTKLGFFDLESLRLLEQTPSYKWNPCRTCGQIPVESHGGIVIEGNEDNLSSLGMSVGVILDVQKKFYCVYTEPTAKSLIKHLHNLDLIVGYNIRRFDYRVLEPYGGSLLKFLPTFDMFLEVEKATGKMVSLANLANYTLDIKTEKLGAKAVERWWEGDTESVIEYCRSDVAITQALFNRACKEGYLKYWNHDERRSENIETHWWAEQARSIVDSNTPKPNCPVREDY